VGGCACAGDVVGGCTRGAEGCDEGGGTIGGKGVGLFSFSEVDMELTGLGGEDTLTGAVGGKGALCVDCD
jgi:hypothetical protein